MNVLLIEPPKPPPALPPFGTSEETATIFSPPWELLCLQSFLLHRSRHTCRFLDTRLASDLEAEVTTHLMSLPSSPVLVVNTSSLSLGSVAAVLEIAKRVRPETITVTMGQHPSQFPELAMNMPRVDYALSGDPETILRNLLDCIDMPPRLHLVPGLVFKDRKNVQPYWLDNLRSLVLGEWTGAFWSGYELGITSRKVRAEIRMSRGSPNTPADRHFGRGYEPLREWPMDKLASKVMQASHQRISEVFVQDSPGFWTWKRLNRWMEELNRVRNTQVWGLQLLPACLDEDTVARLAHTKCRHIKFIFPSCDPNLLSEHGCLSTAKETRHTMNLCANYGITTQVVFWVGGPEEVDGEKSRLAKTLKELDPDRFSLHAFPYQFDTPDYEKLARSYHGPKLDEWIHWAKEPWLETRPVAMWGGPDQIPLVHSTIQKATRSLRRDPRRLFRRTGDRLRSMDLSEATDKAQMFLHGKRHKT